jgi:hypothetical protein
MAHKLRFPVCWFQMQLRSSPNLIANGQFPSCAVYISAKFPDSLRRNHNLSLLSRYRPACLTITWKISNMLKLTDLPNEVLGMICQQLLQENNALEDLAQVTKQLRPVAHRAEFSNTKITARGVTARAERDRLRRLVMNAQNTPSTGLDPGASIIRSLELVFSCSFWNPR